MRIPTEPCLRPAVRRSYLAAVAAAGMAVALSWPQAARADAASDLEKAHGAYVAHKYDDADARLRALLDPSSPGALKDPDSIADARMYLAAVLLAKGKSADAQAVLDRLLFDKPEYQPDPLRVSLQATDALVDARARQRERLATLQAQRVRQAQEEKARADAERQRAALRQQMLEKLASEQVVIERHSRWVATLPFGAGQFQNGQDPAGWLFLSTESLLVLGSIASAGVTLYDEGQAADAVKRHDSTAPVYTSRAQLAAWVGDAFVAGFVLTAVAGVVHAHLTFVPQVTEVRRRELPALSLSLVPWVDPGFGREPGAGAVAGVRGTF